MPTAADAATATCAPAAIGGSHRDKRRLPRGALSLLLPSSSGELRLDALVLDANDRRAWDGRDRLGLDLGSCRLQRCMRCAQRSFAVRNGSARFVYAKQPRSGKRRYCDE